MVYLSYRLAKVHSDLVAAGLLARRVANLHGNGLARRRFAVYIETAGACVSLVQLSWRLLVLISAAIGRAAGTGCLAFLEDQF